MVSLTQKKQQKKRTAVCSRPADIDTDTNRWPAGRPADIDTDTNRPAGRPAYFSTSTLVLVLVLVKNQVLLFPDVRNIRKQQDLIY